MKKIAFLFLFSLFTTVMYSQASIKVYTLLDEAKFKIMLNGEVENVIPIKEAFFDNLPYKEEQNIRIVFTADSIADIDVDILLLENEKKEFEILKKTEIHRKGSKVGRKIGKFLKIGKHNKDEILYDVFYLEDRTKSDFYEN